MLDKLETYDNEDFPNIVKYIQKKLPDWRQPIILHWLNNAYSMNQALKVIDKKVGYLLDQNAGKKLEQWFSSDRDFNSITAERYIIDYLKTKNNDITDLIYSKVGVDAELNYNSEKLE